MYHCAVCRKPVTVLGEQITRTCVHGDASVILELKAHATGVARTSAKLNNPITRLIDKVAIMLGIKRNDNS